MELIQKIKLGYRILPDGRVHSRRSKKDMYQETTALGYKRVTLAIDGKNIHFKVHRLVAIFYLPNPGNLPEVNHKNGVRWDNRVSNLEWCDHLYNMQDAVRRGTHYSVKLKAKTNGTT